MMLLCSKFSPTSSERFAGHGSYLVHIEDVAVSVLVPHAGFHVDPALFRDWARRTQRGRKCRGEVERERFRWGFGVVRLALRGFPVTLAVGQGRSECSARLRDVLTSFKRGDKSA